MKFAIIISKKDKAGMNIKEFLDKKDFENLNVKIYTIKEESIYCEDVDKEINADIFIFATKHKSESKKPSLCIHTPGNWNKAEFGGKNKELCIAFPSFMKCLFLELNKNTKSLDYPVTLEVTHHGPFLEKPCLFIEIGSSEENWVDKKAGEIISKTIFNTIKNFNETKYKIAVGLGGMHYAETFNKILLRTDIAIGHICPKYLLKFLDKELLRKAIEKNKEKVDFILLDWKGLGKEKARILQLINELKLEYKRTDQINKS